MAHPAGEADCGALRLDFDRRLKLEFHGSQITSDAGLLAFRELDDVLGLSQMAGSVLTDTRTAKESQDLLGRWDQMAIRVRQAQWDRPARKATRDLKV